MRAVRITAYGPAETLVPTDVPGPVPGPGQEPIKVEAAVALLVDGAYAVGWSRRDPSAARRAKAAAATLLTGRADSA
jgi:NADPH2:quinone reductase